MYQGKTILFCGGTKRGFGQCYTQSLKDFYEKKYNSERRVQDDHWELSNDIYMLENRIQPTAVMIDDDTWWVTGGHTGDEKGLDSTDILKYIFVREHWNECMLTFAFHLEMVGLREVLICQGPVLPTALFASIPHISS